MMRRIFFIVCFASSLFVSLGEAKEQIARPAHMSGGRVEQEMNTSDGHGHRQNGPEACRQVTISTLRAWGNPIEILGMAMVEAGPNTWLIRIDDMTRSEQWRAAVSVGICSARQEDNFWRVESFFLRPFSDPAEDCVASMLQGGRALQATEVRRDGVIYGRSGHPLEITVTLLSERGRPVASGTCPLVETPEGAFVISAGRIEPIR